MGNTECSARMKTDSDSEPKIREIHFNDPAKNKGFVTNGVHTTKYTPLSFIFLFLMNELSRPANVFFCLIILIQQFDRNDPDKFSTILPLSLVLGFTALKEIYEDYSRSIMDKKANYTTVSVVRGGELVDILCKDLKVGDIVRVSKEKRFPADLILLSSSEPAGIAYLETSNVDGESNLKIRMSNQRTAHLLKEADLSAYRAVIKCEQPNERIYNFEGSVTTDQECFSLDQGNLLLRGAALKNTAWIYGVVVYTGHETKIMMNSSETPYKRTKMEKSTDKKYLYISIGLGGLTVIGASLNAYYYNYVLQGHWYLQLEEYSAKTFITMLLAYLLLLNTLLPISLSVTLEFIKFVMAILVDHDLELYDEETDTQAVARSSNLMEELGQVQCILTDKTGTLTCNEMILRHLIIEGEVYLDCKDPESNLFRTDQYAQANDFFLKILSTCHTIMIDYSDPLNPCYQGSSPDELAMVNVAADLGYKFINRSVGNITIEVRGTPITIEIFAVIEFTSARKRMSVVALLPDGEYYLFCKGADSIILERLDPDSANSEQVKKSLQGLEKFASDGLRTLCFAYRKLDKDFTLQWLDKWTDALNTVTDRQEQIDSVAQLIERDMHFIGATGVEDRLQNDVPVTIKTLMKANIKIWMLTGDRFETAVSTAFLSGLVEAETIQFHLLNPDLETVANSLDNFLTLIDANGKNGSNFALVLNGPVVEIILSDEFLNSPQIEKLRRIVQKSRTLLCCRLSPLQKSQITRFAREKLRFVTLAVGDGGNDVSMIQAANVGVGISGKEGLQASRSADFAIAQFKHLTKLILVHGSWSLHRLSRVIMYSIYKNFVLFFTQFWYSFYNGASAQTFFEPWMYICWNIIFTCWPPTFIGLTDQYVYAKELIENPQLYTFGQTGKFYDSKSFWRSTFNAIFHSFLIFFSLTLMFPEGFILPDQHPNTSLMNGSIVFACILSVVSLKILLFTNYLTVALGGIVVLSVAAWYIFIPLSRSNFLKILNFRNASSLEVFSSPIFWAFILLVPVLVLSRDFLWKFYRRQFRPHPYHIVQELKLKEPAKASGKSRRSSNLVFNGPEKSPRKSRGFSFSQTYGQTRVLEAYGQSPKLSPTKSKLAK